MKAWRKWVHLWISLWKVAWKEVVTGADFWPITYYCVSNRWGMSAKIWAVNPWTEQQTNREWKSVCTEGRHQAEPQAGIGNGCGGAVFAVLILITLRVFSHSYCWRGQLALHTVPSSADHIPDTCKLSAVTPWAVPFSAELHKKISRVVWSIRAVFAFMLNPCSMQNITSL